MGEETRVAYQSAKAGLCGLTRHTATLGGKHGVRCNSVAPGVILTGAALANTTEEDRNEILASVRSNRLGVPEDLAAMVAFCSRTRRLRHRSNHPRRRRRQLHETGFGQPNG
jgi:NAD(P)-dependent dehydrogenase (short-subunit alcohol dehydrogenase family)